MNGEILEYFIVTAHRISIFTCSNFQQKIRTLFLQVTKSYIQKSEGLDSFTWTWEFECCLKNLSLLLELNHHISYFHTFNSVEMFLQFSKKYYKDDALLFTRLFNTGNEDSFNENIRLLQKVRPREKEFSIYQLTQGFTFWCFDFSDF